METEKKEASIPECQVQAGLHVKNKPNKAALGFCQPAEPGRPCSEHTWRMRRLIRNLGPEEQHRPSHLGWKPICTLTPSALSCLQTGLEPPIASIPCACNLSENLLNSDASPPWDITVITTDRVPAAQIPHDPLDHWLSFHRPEASAKDSFLHKAAVSIAFPEFPVQQENGNLTPHSLLRELSPFTKVLLPSNPVKCYSYYSSPTGFRCPSLDGIWLEFYLDIISLFGPLSCAPSLHQTAATASILTQPGEVNCLIQGGQVQG